MFFKGHVTAIGMETRIESQGGAQEAEILLLPMFTLTKKF